MPQAEQRKDKAPKIIGRKDEAGSGLLLRLWEADDTQPPHI